MTQNPSLVSLSDSRLLPEADAIRSAAWAACGIADAMESAPGPLDSPNSPPAGLALDVTLSLEAARYDVLEGARRMVAAHRRQHAARLEANDADTEWAVACFSSGATREEQRRSNRARREARRAHEAAWHDYQAAAQQLCRATEWMVELEALEDVTHVTHV